MSQTFEALGLQPDLLRAVHELGYEQPTPIQNAAIPLLLNQQDIIGQAQTGTGKTAAFALPMLQQLDMTQPRVQGLVLTPTRELALQVAEAVESYGQHRGARVAAIYGGAAYARQLRKLADGAQIVVGTPGRMIDLIERGKLDLSGVRYLVLDEADEMLKMGFVEDVETILAQTPTQRQTALFSATMPDPIRALADRYMREPQTVTIKAKALTVPQTEQRYYLVHEETRMAALTRLIEVEDLTSALIFTRTKLRAAELAETLLSRGYQAEALHGDLNQEARETVLRRFRSGQVIFLVATDVVARGVDIPTVSHVVNYDMPHDAEDYVHRIGRTGRAGRPGVAITLVTPRERRWLHMIEDYTRQRIERATLPSTEAVHTRRDERFVGSLRDLLESHPLEDERGLVARIQAAGYDPLHIAAAAMRIARAAEQQRPVEEIAEANFARGGDDDRRRQGRGDRGRFGGPRREQEPGMVRFLLEAGKAQGIRPADIVGAIAGEAGIPGKAIGAIDIGQHQTFFDVRERHAEQVARRLDRISLRGRPVTVRLAHAGGDNPPPRRERRPERA